MNSRFLVLLICALSFFPVFGNPPKNYVTSHPLDGSMEMDDLGRREPPKTPRKNSVTSRGLDKAERDAKTFVQRVGKAEPPRTERTPRKSIFTRVWEWMNNSLNRLLSTSPPSNVSESQGMGEKSSVSVTVETIENIIKHKSFNSRPIAMNKLVAQIATSVRDAILETDLLQRVIVGGHIREAQILTKTLQKGDRVKFSIPMLVSQSGKPWAHLETKETKELIPIRKAEFYDHYSKEVYPDAIFLKVDSILLALAKGISRARINNRGVLFPAELSSCFELMKLASAEEFNTKYTSMDGPNAAYHLPITELLLDSVEPKLKTDFKKEIAEISTKAQRRDGRPNTIVP